MSEKRKTIGVFAEHFQGSFIGEIANQVRYGCFLRKYHYVGYATGNLASYECELGIEHLDAVIIIRNCITTKLAKKFTDLKIPTVSIGFDFFPLDIPVIGSNNALGAELAVEYLISNNAKNIAFMGDLGEYDVRKRFEKFIAILQSKNYVFDDDMLFNTKNSEISG